MAELKLTIDGKVQKFQKKQFFIKENILALQFSMKQEKYLRLEEPEIEDIEKNQLNFAEFMSEVFEKQFTPEEFINGCLIEDKDIAEDIYIQCLGGNSEDKEKKGKK